MHLISKSLLLPKIKSFTKNHIDVVRVGRAMSCRQDKPIIDQSCTTSMSASRFAKDQQCSPRKLSFFCSCSSSHPCSSSTCVSTTLPYSALTVSKDLQRKRQQEENQFHSFFLEFLLPTEENYKQLCFVDFSLSRAKVQ